MIYLLLITTCVQAMEQPIANIQPAQVDAAAQAIHNHATQGSGHAFLERCAEGIIVGVSINLFTLFCMDLYQGSKGYTYKLLFGYKPKEKKMALEIESLQDKKEKSRIKIAEGHTKNYMSYKTVMDFQMQQCKNDNEKTILLERAKESTEKVSKILEKSFHESNAIAAH